MTRLFFRQDLFAICEVPLPNGRRADMMAIDPKGCLTIVEIKVSRADLLSDLRQRLSWEVAMEYGFNARLGRSLEKAGSSTALPDPALLDAAAGRLALILAEEIGLLAGEGTTPAAVRHFLLGLLERTRVRGYIPSR